MAAELHFYLSGDDLDRLFSVKQARGEDDMSANEFAGELMREELHRLHPQKVRTDED